MVLKDYKKIILAVLLVFFAAGPFSCEDSEIVIVNCNECTKDEPQKATVNIKISPEYTGVQVNIYEGNLEDSIVYSSFKWSAGSTTCSVTINKKYTFTAKYHTSDGKDYIVVDSTTPKVKYTPDQCTDPCYYIYDNVVNLKLKYTK